ncbi:MAG TPA: hypothetical protein VL401_02170 [Alphaproteobacteria bacterium]|jgi:hypothetical protein|nr:hypothetical protein [Alphaproteobacteria bacterium]
METGHNEHPKNIDFVNDPRTQAFLNSQNLDSTRSIPKQELISRGFVLQNQIGMGERTIVQIINGKDFSNTPFLTKDEFEEHKKEVLPENTTDQELIQIGNDMDKFVTLANTLTYVSDLLSPQVGIPKTINFLTWVSQKENFKIGENFIKDFEEAIKEAQNKIKEKHKIPDTLRGIPVSQIKTRKEGANVDNHDCPVLDCNHKFQGNSGIIIYDSEISLLTPNQRRINNVTAHLASHGISNNGEVKDPHQRYFTIKEYMPLFEKRDIDPELNFDPSQLHQEVLTESLKLTMNKLKINLIQKFRINPSKLAEDWIAGR